MQECKVLAIKKVDFVNQENGERVSGHQLYVSSDTRDPAWNGTEVIKCWVPAGSSMEPNLLVLSNGDSIMVEFNRRGKAVAFDLV